MANGGPAMTKIARSRTNDGVDKIDKPWGSSKSVHPFVPGFWVLRNVRQESMARL